MKKVNDLVTIISKFCDSEIKITDIHKIIDVNPYMDTLYITKSLRTGKFYNWGLDSSLIKIASKDGQLLFSFMSD